MNRSASTAQPRARRLLIVATHPIQYQAPLFRELGRLADLQVEVLFAHRPTARHLGDGFGVDFQWDIDLVSGYQHRWMANVSRKPGLDTFLGCSSPEVRHIIQTEAPDALLVMGWNTRSYVQAVAAARRLRVPVLVRGDSHLITHRSAFTRAVKSCVYPWWVRRFDACLAVGRRSADYFARYGARRIVFCPHFVDNQRFATACEAARAERGALRARWGCSPHAFVFLFAGKLTALKRPLDAIDAVAACRAAGVDAELLVVGDGALRQACERRALDGHLPVRFAGFVNQSRMPAAYAAADALVLPSTSETWGLVVNEALACGLPAIVSEEAGCAGDFAHEPCVQTFPSGDIQALANAMTSLASRPHRALELRDAAHRVAAKYSVERAATGVVEAVHLVCDAGTTGREGD